jgi:hypothetical protein
VPCLQATTDLKNAQLKECIKAGVGFHHAALDPAERALVEKLFLSMDIMASALFHHGNLASEPNNTVENGCRLSQSLAACSCELAAASLVVAPVFQL